MTVTSECLEEFSGVTSAAADENACAECLLEPVTEDENMSCEDDCATSDGDATDTTSGAALFTPEGTTIYVAIALLGTVVFIFI
jgi:hypothetical protein